MPNVNNEYLNYSDKERKAFDSEKLNSISSSSDNIDHDLDTTNSNLSDINIDLDTTNSTLSSISGKIGTQAEGTPTLFEQIAILNSKLGTLHTDLSTLSTISGKLDQIIELITPVSA